MQRMLQEVRPDRFDDLVALNALYRPGPMDYIPNFKRGKHDPESVKYLDPRLKTILEPTYGVAAYQEQLMEISKSLGGFTPGEADTLRKAIGKKNVRLLAPLKDKFISARRTGSRPRSPRSCGTGWRRLVATRSTRATRHATRSWPFRRHI